MGGVYCLLINLERSSDRLAATTSHLREIGLAFTRLDAVDAKNLSLPLPGVDPLLYRKCHGCDLRLEEVGCYLSHLKAMKEFLKSDFKYALILEDDVRFNSDALKIVTALTCEESPADWDMVRLENRRKGWLLRLRPLFGPYSLCTTAMRATGAAAYLVNRKAAQVYCERLLPMEVPYDHAFDRAWSLGLRIGVVAPYCANTTDLSYASTIETSRKVKVKWWRKWSVLRWRAASETQRVLSALGAYALSRSMSPD